MTTIDTRKFDRAMELYRRARLDKSYAYIANRAVRNVCMQAVPRTPKADPARIAREMGQVATQISRSRKTGEFKARKRIFKDDSFAARIINARLKAKGQALLFGKAMEAAVRKMVGARLRSVAFIRSGWLPAIRLLKRLTGDYSEPADAGRIKGQPKGYGIPARKGTAVTFAEAGNSAQGAGKVGAVALQSAVDVVAADMEAWATEELRKQAKASGW